MNENDYVMKCSGVCGSVIAVDNLTQDVTCPSCGEPFEPFPQDEWEYECSMDHCDDVFPTHNSRARHLRNDHTDEEREQFHQQLDENLNKAFGGPEERRKFANKLIERIDRERNPEQYMIERDVAHRKLRAFLNNRTQHWKEQVQEGGRYEDSPVAAIHMFSQNVKNEIWMLLNNQHVDLLEGEEAEELGQRSGDDDNLLVDPKDLSELHGETDAEEDTDEDGTEEADNV